MSSSPLPLSVSLSSVEMGNKIVPSSSVTGFRLYHFPTISGRIPYIKNTSHLQAC